MAARNPSATRFETGFLSGSPSKQPVKATPRKPPPDIKRTGGRPPRLLPTMDPGDWLTRGDVARHLGVHVSTIRRLEARGELIPHIEEDGGLRYFTLWHVAYLKKRRARKAQKQAAEIRLAAFELFQRGVDWRDVAIRLHYDPLRVHRLWRLFTANAKLG
jgi:hypothetical protein